MIGPLLHILFIEDQPGSVQELRAALQADSLKPIQLTSAECLSGGLDLLGSGQFDLALLDLDLPGSQGLVCIQQLQSQFPALPVIALSANSDPEAAVQALRAGAQDFLVKGQTAWESAARSVRYAIERQRALLQPRASEKHWRALIEQNNDAIAMVSGDGRIQYESPAITRILGYTPEELVGRTALELVHPDEREAAARDFAQILKTTGQTVQTETRFLHKDGHTVWLEAANTNWLADPDLGAIIVNFRDISQHKQAEAELLESEKRFSTAFFASPVSQSIVAQATNQILVVNDACCRMFGFSSEELVGASTAKLYTWENPTDRQAALAELLATGHLRPRETNARLHNGELRTIFAAMEPVSWKGIPCYLVLSLDITDRKQAEEKLRKSEGRAQAMLNAIPDLMFRLDRNGVFLNYKADVKDLYEQSQSLIGLRNRDIAPMEFADLIDRKIEETLASGETQTFEYQMTIPHAGTLDYEARMAPAENNEVVAIVRNITERKQSEVDAVYRQRLLEKVLQLGKNITAVNDLDACLRQIHHSVRQELGFDRVGVFLYDQASNLIQGAYGTSRTGEIQDTSFFRKSLEEWADWKAAMQSPSGMSIVEDFQAVYKPAQDDEMYGVKEHVILAAWAGDKPVALLAVDNLGSHRTITAADLEALQLFASYAGLAVANAQLHAGLEQRIQERTAELEAMHSRLELANRAASLGVWVWNIKTDQLLWDRQVFAIYALPEDTFQPSLEKFLSIVHPEDKEGMVAYIRKILNGLPPSHLEYRVLCGDGVTRFAKAHGIVTLDSAGQPDHIVGVVHDITQEKLAEKALRENEEQMRLSRDRLSAANIALERAALLKDEFLASMSHELRTPLTGILGLSEALLLNTYGALAPRQTRAIQNIEQSGRHLLDLINDILDLSKIEAGMLELKFETCSLTEICQAAIQLTRGMANKKHQQVSLSLPPEITQIRGDRRRLKQTLVNLLSNAIKFTPEGGSLGLEMQPYPAEQVVRLVVWDNGIGIASEHIERLFQPFVQLESSLSRQYEGTGLGLSLVQRMVEMHGGTIQVESQLGNGSRFTMILPWVEEAQAAALKPATEVPAITSALVVEDLEIDAGQATRYLRLLGIESLVQRAGAGVVELAASRQPGLILLDLHLPDIPGLEVLAALKADPRTRAIPVVVCSVEENRSQAAAQGVVGYLVKPYRLEDLRDTLSGLAPTPAQPAAPAPGPEEGCPLILIVDDNDLNVQTLVDFLETQGFHTATAHSGLEALSVASVQHPDLILMDIQMPGMDGLEATQHIRASTDAKTARAPIIAVTALAMPGDRERCLAAGANEYMSKPVRMQVLLELIQKLLGEG